MIRKVSSIVVMTLLIFSTVTVVLPPLARAMNDEHNLSGLIWLSDGSTPPSATGFAIWVEYPAASGTWYRFPDSGWYTTSDPVSGQVWYSMVLPDEWYNVGWGDGSTYRVEVDATPWGEYPDNCTSNGTGSAGDPFPAPYDPTNPNNINNTINYAAGGGYANEQQWDVRTVAPRDLIPTNATVDGMLPIDYPTGIPVGGGAPINIYFNATSIGLLGTGGTFDVNAWVSDASGIPIAFIWENLNLGPLNEYGNTSGNGYDTGILTFPWTVPLTPGDYYINITVDSGFVISEINETNNTIILHFIVGPDLIPIDIIVDGVQYPDWPQISPIILPAPGQWIHIEINLTNVGATNSGTISFSVAFYEVSIIDYTPLGEPFNWTEDVFDNVDVGEVMGQIEGWWYAPAPGEFRINLTVDYYGNVTELVETNNTYVLRVLVGPDVIPTNVTVNGLMLMTSPSIPIPVGLGQTVAVGVNATNIGFSPTGSNISIGFYDSTIDGGMLSPPYFNTTAPELNTSSDPESTYFIPGGYWTAPAVAGIYYITIYVDIANDTFEFNENNNSFVICFIVGPDLTYTNVMVDGNAADVNDPSEIWYAGSGETIMIAANATNMGASETGLGFWVSFTNCTATGQNKDLPFYTAEWPISLLVGDSTTAFIAPWIVPNFVGDLYVNITIDYLFAVSESIETNNTYIIHFKVGPDYTTGEITVNGQYAGDESMVWNATPSIPVNIGVNCTNVGISDVDSTITYTISFYNSTATRTIGEEFDNVSMLSGLTVGGDSGQQIGAWIPPNQPGEYYVLVIVDSANTTWEIDENNNTFLLHFVIGPDLIPTNVSVNGDPVITQTQIWYVGLGEIVTIGANATNIGFSGTGVAFSMSLYNVSISGSAIIGDSNPFDITINALDAGEDSGHRTWLWTVPLLAGEYYINITVDYSNVSWEVNEYNNTFTLHFIVAPDLTPNNMTVDGLPITSYPLETVIVYPGQIIVIGANASNVGITSTGILQFNMTFWNSTITGQTIGALLNDSGLLGPLEAGHFSPDQYVVWIAPSPDKPTDYYINITVDSTWMVSEWVETNNTYILHIRVDAPDLTPDKVEVEAANGSISVIYDEPSTLPLPFVSEEIFVPEGSDVNITFTIANIGGISQTIGTNVTAYNISDIGGSPIDDPFYESGPTVVLLPSGGSMTLTIIWPNPGVSGVFYFNVSIDYNGTLDIGGKIIELSETNNTFTFFINITSKPISTLHAGAPKFQPGVYWYVNSSTELNFTVIGPNPPFYTWYRITDMTTGLVVKDWSNYTAEGTNFTMIWGEGTYQIEYNSTDAIGGIEPTRSRIIIVDDSPPITDIIIGIPQYRANPPDILNVTSATSFDLNAGDLPLGTSVAGPGIVNGSGINGIPESGIYYIIQNLSTRLNVTGWGEYLIGSSFYLNDPTWGDGYYRIWFNSTDNLEQKEMPKFIDVYMDNTGPITSIDVGEPKHPHTTSDWFVTSLTPFNLSAYEALGSGANISTIRFRITNNDTGNTTGWIFGTSFTILNDYPYWAIEGDGNYTIEFRAEDNLGNLGPASNMVVYVDDTPPASQLTIGDPKYRVDDATDHWNITSATPLNLTADDGPDSGIASIYYQINSEDLPGVVVGWTEYSLGTLSFFLTGLPDGNYTIFFNATDNLGNVETSQSERIYLDNTPPVTDINIGTPQYRADPINNVLNISSFTPINFLRDDGPGCGYDFTMYCIYGGIFNTTWLDYLGGFTISSAWSDDIYIIEYYSVDYLGNIEPTNSYTIYLDNTPPATNITIGDPRFRADPFHNWNITVNTQFTLISDDGLGSGLRDILYQIDSLTPNIYNGSYFIITESEGLHTLRYWARDNVFNTETQNEIYIVVDNSPPLTVIVFGDPKYKANQTADILNITDATPINITSMDGGVIPVGIDYIEYMIDDDDDPANGDLTGWVVTDAPFILTGFSDGEYYIYYHAVDLLGNTEIIRNLTIIVDSSSPETIFDVIGASLTEPSQPDVWWITPATSLTLTTDDIGAPPVGLNFTGYRVDGVYHQFSMGIEAIDISGFSNGTHTIQYSGVDLLGNTELTKQVTVIFDDAGPDIYITPTPDVTLPSPLPQQPSIQVNFSEATNLTIDAIDRGVPAGITPAGVWYIEYTIDPDDPNPTWQTITPGDYNIFDMVVDWNQNQTMGFWHHNLSLRAYDNLGQEGPTITIWFYIEGDVIPPLPPVLKAYVRGDDIYLEWEPSISPDIHHYLIYRSTTRTGFDFSNIWVDTSALDDGGVIPLRTSWNDTNAVSAAAEYYYTIRGEDGRGNIGPTSNIAGKVTMTFTNGYNAFALPLEPFWNITAWSMLESDVFESQHDTVYRFDTASQQWIGRPKFMPSSINNFTLVMGESYMLYIDENNIQYTFTGATGTSIRYMDGVGEEEDFRQSLSVEVDGRDVTLNWNAASGATGYSIYRADKRMGPGSLTDYDLDLAGEVDGQTLSWTDDSVTGNEHDYLVVAKTNRLEGGSTYGLGVNFHELGEGYSSFSLVYEVKDNPTLASFTLEYLSQDTDTLYYYNKEDGKWNGHPRFLPENINNGNAFTGTGYLIFVDTEYARFAVVGV